MGGTWDLFRYPGVRSDSDMYTLGYRFRPWRDSKAMADGPSILSYIRDTAAEYGVDKTIRYNHRVRRASWSSDQARWTVEAETGPTKRWSNSRATSSISAPATTITKAATRRSGLASSGFAERSCTRRSGPRISTTQASASWSSAAEQQPSRSFPQWPSAPRTSRCSSARRATSSRAPQRTRWRTFCDSCLPDRAAYMLTRWKNVLVGYVLLQSRAKETRTSSSGWWREACANSSARNTTRSISRRPTTRGTSGCASSPDADLFGAIREGRVSVVTDHIETFTENGLLLKSGEHLDADIIVTATGLVLKTHSAGCNSSSTARLSICRRRSSTKE